MRRIQLILKLKIIFSHTSLTFTGNLFYWFLQDFFLCLLSQSSTVRKVIVSFYLLFFFEMRIKITFGEYHTNWGQVEIEDILNWALRVNSIFWKQSRRSFRFLVMPRVDCKKKERKRENIYWLYKVFMEAPQVHDVFGSKKKCLICIQLCNIRFLF